MQTIVMPEQYLRPPIPANEQARLAALRDYEILDTDPEDAFDAVVQVAANVCRTSTALVSFVDADRQWFKARIGTEAKETPRSIAFCAHAILRPHEIFVVNDARKDNRFAGNPLVANAPHIRFYAGAPVLGSGGEALGTLCVIDTLPRPEGAGNLAALPALSRVVTNLLEQKRRARALERANSDSEGRYVALLQSQADFDQRDPDHAGDLSSAAAGARLSCEHAIIARLQEVAETSNGVSVLIVEVDDFDRYVGAFGQLAGYQVLRTVALILHYSMRTCEHIVGYGSGEFAMILPNASRAEACDIAERVRLCIQKHAWPHRPVTVSVGVASGRTPNNAHLLLGYAEAALHRARMSGRNRVAADTTEMPATS
jgi:diguanylate cyclase (GGDEF)-like protein